MLLCIEAENLHHQLLHSCSMVCDRHICNQRQTTELLSIIRAGQSQEGCTAVQSGQQTAPLQCEITEKRKFSDCKGLPSSSVKLVAAAGLKQAL